MMYLARILSTAEDASPGVEPGGTKKGWLQIVYKGEVRLARPCYGMGRFTPPSPLWVAKYADKFGVWIIPEMSNDSEEREDHLVYVGFDPYENTIPADVESAFPQKKLFQTDRWELVVDDGAEVPSVVLRYKGDPQEDANPHPDDGVGTEVLRITQEDGEQLIRLQRVDPAGTTTAIEVDKDEVRILHQDGTNKAILKNNELELILDEGASLKVVGKESATVFTVGDGTNHVAIVEHLQSLYESLKVQLDAHDAHVHPTGVGPSGPATVLVVCPPWDSEINSTKVKIPNG